VNQFKGHGQDMQLSRIVSFLFMALTVACAPVVASRGSLLDSDRLAEVKVGASTREDVAKTLGTPTMVSSFDDKTWYYVGRKTEQYSFLDPEVIEQKAVELKFTDEGIVTGVRELSLADVQEVNSVERRTPTYGNDDTFIKQLIGNLSRPTPSTTSRREGQ